MPSTDELVRYADLILQVGLGMPHERRLLVRADVEAVALVRVLVERAYRLGCPRVDVMWTDQRVDVLAATVGPDEAATVDPDEAAQVNAAAARGDAYLQVRGGAPVLPGDAGGRFATRQATWRAATAAMFQQAGSGGLPWAIVGHPTAAWAAQVLPDEPDAEERLWEAIARVCRLDTEDPVAAWREHAGDLARRAEHLNGLDLVRLEYDGPGTDLAVGVDGRRWAGGTSGSPFGALPNIPTEEVFTSPDCRTVEGTLAVTKPYVFAGEAIAGAQLRFEDGLVADAHCDAGDEALRRLLDTDDGSRRVGEVALVPHSSRVAREQLQWRHVLYDENEDCHLALGQSYTFTAPDAVELDPDERLATAGLSQSRLHEDLVVGSDALDVTGVDREGRRHPLLVAGEWGFDVT